MVRGTSLVMMPWLGRRWHRAAKRHCLVVEARARPAKMGSALKNKSRGIKPERRRSTGRDEGVDARRVDGRASEPSVAVGRSPPGPASAVRRASYAALVTPHFDFRAWPGWRGGVARERTEK